MKDGETGRSRGFSSPSAAVAGMNNQELDGRRLMVNQANASGGGGDGGGGGGYGGGGYQGGGGSYGGGY